MKILLDTNVIFDVLTKRDPFYIDSARVWTFIKEEFIEGCISAITIPNLYYIINKLKGNIVARAFVDEVLEDFQIISLTKDILRQASTVTRKDFEDLIQYFSAIHEGCECIITRNKKDFPSAGIKLMTPSELLKGIESK